ncbi:MAG TPA: hypothetical protein VHL78_09435 [Actinomycetota bacterium]|nr:hypothetical protein [Actinomycetota bacterium]
MPIGDLWPLLARADPAQAHHHLWLASGWLPAVATALAAGAVLAWPSVRRPVREPAGPLDPWDGPLSALQTWTRAAAVGFVVLAAVAGRVGDQSELRNIASALVAAGWPLAVFVSAAGGPIWRWLDPWDGAARLLGSGDPGPKSGDVRLAVGVAVAWTWYLSAYPTPLAPRTVGLALAAYGIAMLAGSLVVGRRLWLSRTDVFGVFLGWLGRLPRGALRAWSPPRGSEALLGVLAGGLLFGLVRRSNLWGELNVVPAATALATLGLLGSCALVAVALMAAERWAAARGAPGAVAAAAVPAVAAVAVAASVASSRVFTAVQLLPRLASDPLALGWDLFGTADLPIQAPVGPARELALQLAVLVVGHAAGAAVAAGRPAEGRLPVAVALAALMAAASASMVAAAVTVLGVQAP